MRAHSLDHRKELCDEGGGCYPSLSGSLVPESEYASVDVGGASVVRDADEHGECAVAFPSLFEDDRGDTCHTWCV